MKKTFLKEFQFSVKETKDVLSKGVCGRTVEIPHTWNVDDGLEDYRGTGWYSACFQVEKPAFRMFLFFHAVYRDCVIYLNGKRVYEHNGSGYTPFEVDVTNVIRPGENLLVVQCCNVYSESALPNGKNFDWANDGGIIRPVELLEYSGNAAQNIRIYSEITQFKADGKCDAMVYCDVEPLQNMTQKYTVSVKPVDENQDAVFEREFDSWHIAFPLKNALLWDTEAPHLYELELNVDGIVQTRRFGIRKIETRGNRVFLNNREIRLLAVEWMPGSNPAYGMAEPKSELRKNLEMLKELNCNFTRFHWQQDDYVLDWCDEHGLMVQEEIPYWGCPKCAGEQQLDIAKQQADEMMCYHANHPSLVCWGVGNELDGWSQDTAAYVKEMVSYFKKRDRSRLVNYVSNSFGRKKCGLLSRLFGKKSAAEATTYGDICMWNEYLGTWQPAKDYDRVFRYALENAMGKPLVVTEFGLCEPAFKGGDKRRIEIYREKLALYRKYDLAGWVYFCLNDYRTHVGETGKGKLKQRVHGSTDLYGNKKPSFVFVQENNRKDDETYNRRNRK